MTALELQGLSYNLPLLVDGNLSVSTFVPQKKQRTERSTVDKSVDA